jgi:hypothetical protein
MGSCGVLILPIPTGVTLDREAMIEGMTDEIGGRIVDDWTEQRNDHTVWFFVAEADRPGQSLHVRQAIVRIGDNAYKAMATGVNADKTTAGDLRSFVDSITIDAPTADGSNPESTSSGKASDRTTNRDRVQDWSRKLGRFGAYALVIALIVWVATKSRKKQSKD